ncbi:molybdopterin-guanine dinucleotide biosynthesis protein B [Ornithinibacillus halophilus]|uniref:Molybdopterin-guanine dinucleotide biosynthesis protein B n=1 Tax=Ornithinibacillus halophilus TaxID=930117 RepID=A0A1M5FJR1_9BACI|nr:molybdopterin-guanine dinucleotide biosynthesis protein B [Ornithinibacillus halophilus]SHF91847.1 molybdopterin-guanine dinucleotide biosynthesis protein B [Ornithinibacillus halophilus]
MNVIQVVGYKNRGKTTLVTKIVDFLANQGIRVGTLKHHGHGGLPIGFSNTDSQRHKRAGATISGVEGDGLLQLSISNEWKLPELIAIYEHLGIEMLVIEGFKYEHYNKVLLINDESDLPLLHELTNVVAVVTTSIFNNGFPTFQPTEVEELCDLLLK